MMLCTALMCAQASVAMSCCQIRIAHTGWTCDCEAIADDAVHRVKQTKWGVLTKTEMCTLSNSCT